MNTESSLSEVKNTKRILVSLLCLVGLALIATVPFLVSSVEQKSALVANLQDIQKSTQDIVYYDEVLTMSARMHAYSLQAGWLTRYFDNAEKLDDTLAAAKLLDPSIKQAIEATSEANDKLIAIETRSFQLAESGHTNEAIEILLNQEYKDLKLEYQRNIQQALENAKANTVQAIEVLHREKTQIFSVLFLTLSVSFIAVCIFLFRHFKESDIAIRALVESLDNKIIELNETNVRLLKADGAKDAFLANISHELRTPMNGICGSLQLLKDEKLDENALHLIDTALRSADILIMIVNEILDLSKIKAGKLKLEHRNFNLVELLTDVEVLFTKECQIKDIVFGIERHIQHEEWRGDSLRIKQILLNVLNNAVKFTDSGHISLIIDSNVEQKRISITISDSGIGMNELELSKLFQTFEQADPSTTRKYGGTGLGMTIVKSLVEAMEGTIDVTSEKGKGTNVEIVLSIIPTMATKRSSSQIEEYEELNLTALVAEDNKINQVIAQKMLDSLGCHVVMANNGKEAMQLLDDTFDVILMDIQMPEMDGIKACELIKERRPYLPVIALTANVRPVDIEKYMATGFDDVIDKPLKKRNLNAKLKEISMSSRVTNHRINDKIRI